LDGIKRGGLHGLPLDGMIESLRVIGIDPRIVPRPAKAHIKLFLVYEPGAALGVDIDYGYINGSTLG
jgi:hypothetical protein